MGNLHKASIGKFREDLSDLLNAVRFGRDVVEITKHGKTMGVVISEEEYKKYLDYQEDLEDKEDILAAEKSIKESEREDSIPWEQVKKDLDIDI